MRRLAFRNLGKRSDAAIARMTGVARQEITYLRGLLSVPVFDPWAAIDPYLGRYPDGTIAAVFGCHRATVLRRRRKRGIAAANPRSVRAERALQEWVDALKS